MADNFLTTTYVDALLGNKVRVALFTDGETYKTAAFVGTAQAATASIQQAIKSAGYAVPTSTTDEYIKLATLGEFVVMAYGRLDKKAKLPEDWYKSPMGRARADILSGDAELSLEVSVVGGHGGISSSDYTSEVSNGGHPTIFHRADLEDF